jgi:multidrug efflux pump subunit AcrA (membrane-fusion protein)
VARWITIILAIIGTAIGVWAVSTAKQKPPELPLARPASVNPFSHGVAALGIVEPAGRDVGIVAPEPGLVVEVYTQVGDRVEKGAPLFKLDTRRLDADLLRAESAVEVGKAEIERWHALPRAEDLPPLEAAVTRAEALLKDRQESLRLTQDAVGRGAGNTRDISAAQYAVDAAAADFEKAKADLAKAKAGAWKPDLTVAEANLKRMEDEVAALRLLVERMTVRAPRDGTVLRRGIEPGEYAATEQGRASMIIGDLSRLNVRAQVDEEDIALVRGTPKAIARARGAVAIEVPLKLLRIEPYARPKTELTGSTLERVDTRVVDVVFEIEGAPPASVYPGEGVDVFIEAGGGGADGGGISGTTGLIGRSP